MAEVYFENVNTGRRYKVVRFVRETNKVVLQGETAEFTEDFDKEKFLQWGYVLKQGG